MFVVCLPTTGLKQNAFLEPTEIQRDAIGVALRGQDVLGAAKTGSGKTLAFIVPVRLHMMFSVDVLLRHFTYI